MQRPPMNPQPNPFGTTFSGAGSGFIRGGLSAYGEKFLGSSSEFMQNKQVFSDPQYYFQVNDQFSPEALSLLFTKGLAGWFLQVLLLKGILYTLGSGEAPLLDIVAYGGYAFTGISLAVLLRIFWSYSYYFMMPWMCVCMGVFLVKTMKRVLFAEMRSYGSSRLNYMLLFMAAVQIPLFFWLGGFGA
ncbi:hypothetical protein QJS10_CPA05g01473 [Acorus calamus]|uniref:Uncharacterized protein n=1 Tax=Acorus calamus TaxID=4465 RepID=A0AAV9EWT3_ACOCL|nr:hypothetical protein QJS10_CPA05g01473 [Acorus calamus]